MSLAEPRGARAQLLLAAVVIGTLPGCGSEIASREQQEIPSLAQDEVWLIGITDPRGDWHECFSDDSIAESLMSADLPSSRASATFRPEAREPNVRRVVACLDRSLTGGAMTVTTTESH